MSGKLKLTTTTKGNVITKTLSFDSGYVVKQISYKVNKGKKTIISYRTRKYKIEYGILKNKVSNCKFYGPTFVEQYVPTKNDEKLECSTMILRHSKADNKHYVGLPLDNKNVILITNNNEVYIKRIANLYRRLPNDSRVVFKDSKRFLSIFVENSGTEKFELPLSDESKIYIKLRYTNLEYDFEEINLMKLPVPSKFLFLK